MAEIIKVSTLEQLNEADGVWVKSVCPNCKDESTSTIANARIILTLRRCIWCEDEDEVSEALTIQVV